MTTLETLDRVRGCLFGQLIGDALGSLVEFRQPSEIARMYPDGVRELHDGGTWNTIAGQPTDDSEMALGLARSLVRDGTYDQHSVRSVYVDWLNSGPFDIGGTISSGLSGVANYDSQANGSLMRISPLGIFAAELDADLAARFAREDAWITHPNEVTQDANVLYALLIAAAIREQLDGTGAYRKAIEILEQHSLLEPIQAAVKSGEQKPPASFTRQQGWVLIALQNAFYQLRNAASFEDALVETVGQGGDTDTNAAICGALLGAVYGQSGMPQRWIDVIEQCAPESGKPGVNRPRPRDYWPNDAAELAEQVYMAGLNYQ